MHWTQFWEVLGGELGVMPFFSNAPLAAAKWRRARC